MEPGLGLGGIHRVGTPAVCRQGRLERKVGTRCCRAGGAILRMWSPYKRSEVLGTDGVGFNSRYRVPRGAPGGVFCRHSFPHRHPPYSVQRRDQNKTSPPSFAAFGRKGWPFLQLSVWVGVSGMSVCKTTKGPLLEGMLACKNVQRSVVRRRHAPDVPDRPPAKKGGVGGMPPTACFAWGGGATR